MSEEPLITSPPYPGRTTTIRSMYRDLSALREWILEQQREIYEDIPPKLRSKMLAPESMDTFERWNMMISIEDHYTAYQYARHIREWWDQVIREHEDSWGSRLCLRKRFHLLNLAAYVLREAFVDAEKREAREQALIHQHEKRMKAMHKRMQAMMEEEDYTAEEDAEEFGTPQDDDMPTDSWDDWGGGDDEQG